MNESEDQVAENASTESGETVTPPAPASSAIDAVNRPDASWLDDVEGEVEDVDLVLKCLARDSATVCKTCDELKASGNLDARPVLSRCAGTKQAR